MRTMLTHSFRYLAALAVSALLIPAVAEAQGRGNAFGRGRGGPSTTGSAAPAGAAEGGFRQFGSWLDDATLLEPGQGWTSLSWGRFRSSTIRQTTFPTMDAGFGLTDRVQAGITLPYYRLSLVGGPEVISGMGDVYLSAKVSLLEPGDRWMGVGLAVTPLVEFLDTADPDGGRVSWAAPLSVEWRGEGFRVFGSTGYFTRGAFFGGGAIEVPLSDRAVMTAAFTHTQSTNDNLLADAANAPNVRNDLTAVGAWFLTPSLAVYGGLGQTFSIGDDTTMMTAGLSWLFVPRLAR